MIRSGCVLLSLLALGSSLHAQTTPIGETLLADRLLTALRDPLPVPGPNLRPPALSQPAGPPPTPPHTGVKALLKDLVDDFAHLPSKENLAWAGAGGALALAVHPADEEVNQTLVNSDLANDIFKPGAVLGQSYTLFAASAAIYLTGRLRHEPKVSHVGMDLIQALVISEGLTQTLKYTTRRERPDGSGPTSFPSGHAADTFAFATALERHLGWKGAVPAYAFASYVAISRLPANRHWLSDAVFGSSVGIIAGRTVTRHGRPFPVTAAVVPGGAAVLYVPRTGNRKQESGNSAGLVVSDE